MEQEVETVRFDRVDSEDEAPPPPAAKDPTPPPTPPPPKAVVPMAKPLPPAPPILGDTDEIDMSFLDRLANKKKLKSRDANADFMGDHEDLEMYGEDDIEAARQIDRRRRLRQEAEAADDEEELEAIKAGPDDDDDAESNSSSSSLKRRPPDLDQELFASMMAAPKPKKTKPRPKPRKSKKDADDNSVASSLNRDPFRKKKSKAQLYLEERNHKAARVARIHQLEAKGIECSLPEDSSTWMSLPLDDLDNCQVLMETIYRRKGKIQKMRAGFFALNKLLVWGATSHPGPEFLKFYKIKGFDRKIAEEIDEFDDDLEKLWDMWFGESGEMHPLLSIALIEASMMGNYVMAQSGQPTVKTEVKPPNANGSSSGGGLGGAASGILGGLMSMLNNNPQMSSAVQQVVAAAPPPQPAAAPASIFNRNYGTPPVTVDAPPMDIGLAHQLQRQSQQIENLETRLRMAKGDDALRSVMDSVVERHSQQQPDVDDVDEGAKEPVNIDVPATASRGRRRRRGGD